MSEANSNKCNRCGKCCLSGGPALHTQDLPLIQEHGVLDLRDLVTLRKGEMAYDQPTGEFKPIDQEIIKIKGQGGQWACKFFDMHNMVCAIYENRPLECSVLDCRNPEPLEEMYDKDRLSRAHLLPENHPLLDLMAEHDENCPVGLFPMIVKEAKAGNPEAERDLAALVVYDREIRRMVKERMELDDDSTTFLFGRSVETLLRAMGGRVVELGDNLRIKFSSY